MSCASLMATHSVLPIQNVMTVRYAQIIVHLKIATYPTHSDYYSLVIKFKILSLSKSLISFVWFCLQG